MIRQCCAETCGLLTTRSQVSARPITVTVLRVKSNVLEEPRRRAIFLTTDTRTTASAFFSFFLRMTSSPSHLAGFFRRLPFKSTSLFASKGVRSMTYHTPLRLSNRICSGRTSASLTTTAFVRLEPSENLVRDSLSKNRNSSPSVIFKIRLSGIAISKISSMFYRSHREGISYSTRIRPSTERI